MFENYTQGTTVSDYEDLRLSDFSVYIKKLLIFLSIDKINSNK